MSSLEERVRADNEMAARAGTLPPPVYLEDEVEIIEQATRNVEEGEEEDDTDRLIDGLTDGSDEVVVVPAAGGVRDSRTGRIGGNNVRVATRRCVNSSRRIPPFPNVNTDDGKKNGLEIMRCAKRAGWGNSLKHGKRNQWLGTQLAVWFGEMKMFRQYKSLNAQ